VKEAIDQRTRAARRYYGDEACERFHRELAEGRFRSTRCPSCGETAFPPRSFCPWCLAREVEWVDLPRRGLLYAFTTQERSLRFSRPDVLGLVELPGVGRILTRIAAAFDTLAIGIEVEVAFHQVGPDFVVHEFRPVEAP
jgi:uncharacterized OB-fold protein